MGNLSNKDLLLFQQAIRDDYGVEITENELYKSAFDLLKFVEALIKFDMEDKNNENGQKVLKST